MSVSWAAPQGHIGDLRSKSKDELHEILSRQQKLLSNKRFIQSLPDKGKKIADFVEKVNLTLHHLEEEERKQASLISVRSEFQVKYEQALSKQNLNENLDSSLDFTSHDNSDANVSISAAAIQENGPFEPQASTEELVTAGGNTPALMMEDTGLVEAFGRFTLAQSKSGSNPDYVVSQPPANPFLVSKHLKKPHYIEVLEKTEKSVKARKAKFKPNQLKVKSESSSPSQDSGNSTPLTAEARRLQDRKHLDDITAAKLPPLHHSPAQLLSLEESAALLQEQTKKCEELQAKQAAQKLADGLSIRMESYNPDGGSLTTYREVHDEGTQLSSEED